MRFCEPASRAQISKLKEASIMWQKLNEEYEPPKLYTRYLIFRDLVRARQSDYKSITDYALAIRQASARCANTCAPIPDWQQVCCFRMGLNPKMEQYIFALMESAKAPSGQ